MITYTYSGDLSDKSNIQENILLIERELLKMDQADIKTEHIFIDGIYERKIDKRNHATGFGFIRQDL